MTSKLGPYWSVEHRRKEDYQYFKALQPTVHLIMDGGPPDYAFVHDNEPNAWTLARDWALSEQHADMLANPIGTGQRHAQEWNDHQAKLLFDRNKTFILGINEPHVWEAGVSEALRLYTISLCLEAKKYGLRVGAMQLGVGWPGNNGPDTPPDWSPFHGVEAAIIDNGGALICHEYWADKGPSENWGWWAGRTLKCPWQVPIVVGECGVDMFVKDTSVGQQNRGWVGHMPPERYAAELWEYTNRMAADPRFVGCCVFASDYQSRVDWFSFDVMPAYSAILGVKPADTSAPPFETHLPSVSTPPAEPQTQYVNAPAGLRLRTLPNADAAPISIAPYGEQVNVVALSNDGQWAKVSYKGQAGWMYRAYLSDAKPQPVTPPLTPQQPSNEQDAFARCLAFILVHEGGYQNNPQDVGNWTGGAVGVGENKGTNFGISAASYPNVDIARLTREQAVMIYEHDYWQPSGAANTDWPACLILFDTAVLHGVSTALAWEAEVGTNPLAIAAKRLRVYTQMANGDVFWRGWVARVADLLEASKP